MKSKKRAGLTTSRRQGNSRPALLAFLTFTGAVQGHRIASSDNFVILDAEEAQRYRLLGVLPVIVQEAWIQATLALVVLGLLTLVAAAYSQRRQGSRYITTTTYILSNLPEPLERLLFYLHYEASAYLTVLIESVMAVINAPMSIGLNLANRLSSGGFSGTKDAGRQRSYSETLRLGERGSRRGRGAGKVVGAGSSAIASSSRNGKGPQHFPGIWNTGNSCFLNSTLQCLASVDRLRVLLEEIIVQAEEWDVPTPVTDALYDIITQLNSPTTSRTAIVPQQLTDALSRLPQTKVGSFFYAHQQQDAHELLVLITNALDDEVKAIEQERELADHVQLLGLRAVLTPSSDARTRKSIDGLQNPCRALIAQRTACLDCGYVEAVRHYPADELSLNVPPRSGSTTTIEACLQNWSRLEVVDWVCFRCSLLRTVERTRLDVSYLTTLANADPSTAAPNGKQSGGGLSASARKKSGAKRRKLREAKEREQALTMMLREAYAEDEAETREILDRYEIQLEKAFSRAATKQVMLARTPKVLMVHLNRSSYSASNFGASKNNAAILFDQHLDLADIVTGGDLSVRGDRPISRGVTPMDLPGAEDENGRPWSVQQNGRKFGVQNGSAASRVSAEGILSAGGEDDRPTRTQFRLCAIVVHYGGHSSGHYVAFRRRRQSKAKGMSGKGVVSSSNGAIDDIDESDDEGEGEEARAKQIYQALSAAYADDHNVDHQDDWYRISDDSVSRCSWHDVAMQNPFLLFYERIGDPERDSKKTNGVISNGVGHTQAALHIPQGFTPFVDCLKAAAGPRVIQRWEALPFDRLQTMTSSKSAPALINGSGAHGKETAADRSEESTVVDL